MPAMNYPTMNRAMILMIVFALFSLLASGCFGASRRDKERSLQAERLQTVEKTRVDLIERSALLISGIDVKIYNKKIADYNDSPFKCLSTDEKNIKDNKLAGLGMACSVSPGNRYVTAAHCVSDGPPHYVFRVDGQKNVYLFAVDVIWKDEGVDFAILESHETCNLPYFEIGKDSISPGKLVITNGNFSEISAGRILHYANKDNSIFAHSAPVRPGDSGGPVVDENLKLIGITTKYSCLNFPRLWEHESLAASTSVCLPRLIEGKSREVSSGLAGQ
jgi:Trypsin-like peptidase domain